MKPDLWILDGDESAFAGASEQAAAGDLVLRRTGDTVQVGEVTDPTAAAVQWLGDVDAHLLPGEQRIERAENRPTPLQRLQGSSELRAAIDGVVTAHRHRGG